MIQVTKSELKKLQKIKALLDKAEILYRQLPDDLQEEINFSEDGDRLFSCITHGAESAQEIVNSLAVGISGEPKHFQQPLDSPDNVIESPDNVIECDECGAEETVSDTDYTRHSAEQDGWYFGVTTKRTICPSCNTINLNEPPIESASDVDTISSRHQEHGFPGEKG